LLRPADSRRIRQKATKVAASRSSLPSVPGPLPPDRSVAFPVQNVVASRCHMPQPQAHAAAVMTDRFHPSSAFALEVAANVRLGAQPAPQSPAVTRGGLKGRFDGRG